MKKILILILLSLAFNLLSAQKSWIPHQKGKAFAMWGWNRASYSNCDLNIKGADYDLTFYNISAHDRPTEVSYYNYLKIDRITIPQTNFRVGYFIKDNLALSFGVDHMKYVMDQDQIVRAKGFINRKSIYEGTYDGNIKMNEDFLTFEHTDGLNYINAEVEKYNRIRQSKNNNFYLGYILGLSTGALFPKTNVKFLDYERNDRFHFSGFGISAKAAVEAILFKHFQIKIEDKIGYINMPDTILHEKGIEGKGKQHFTFNECFFTLGAIFKIKKYLM